MYITACTTPVRAFIRGVVSTADGICSLLSLDSLLPPAAQAA